MAERKHHHRLEMDHVMMISASLPPHLWDGLSPLLTYIINIWSSAALEGGIPLEPLLDRFSYLFGASFVCCTIHAHRECTKPTTQSVKFVF
jgi:hypothetical protein